MLDTDTAYADLVYLNGQVITMEENQPLAEAVAVKWDRIMSAGSNRAIQNLAGPDTPVKDLKGQTMLPGLIAIPAAVQLTALPVYFISKWLYGKRLALTS